MKRITKIITVLTITGLLTGGILALVYQITLPSILKRQAEELNAAIFWVVPLAKSHKLVKKEEVSYYECFNEKGKLVGFALPAKGVGYQGEIKLMLGINASATKFSGITVLEQVETPGLGAKISEEKFLRQFKELVIRPPLEYIKGRKPSKPNEIEAITGATVSTRSVVNIINRAIEKWFKTK